MKWFYQVTFADGRKHGTGPFDSESVALIDKDALEAAIPSATPGAPFQGEDDYAFPEAIADVARGDGSRCLMYADGSTTDVV